MLPPTWVREPKFRKIRRHHQFWRISDFESLAVHLFGTSDLDGQQLDDLIRELRKPGITPPGGHQERDPVLLMHPNPPSYTGTTNRIYQAGNQVRIQFKDMHTALDWGFRLLTRTNLTWEKTRDRHGEALRLEYFASMWAQKQEHRVIGLPEYTLDHQLVATLKRMTRQWRRLTTRYPDNTPVERTYHVLAPGDQLLHQDTDQLWEVTERYPQLNGPAKLVLSPKEI